MAAPPRAFQGVRMTRCLSCEQLDGWHVPGCQNSTATLRAERDTLATHLNCVSGALCDAGSVPVGGPGSYAPGVRALTAERDALAGQIAELDAERNRCCGDNETLRAALKEARELIVLTDPEGRRAKYIRAPEDPEIEALCERLGYGATMDAAARLWRRKDPIGAHTTGPTAAMWAAALAAIDTALGEP